MFTKLTLINFKKHSDRVFLFESGMNAIRGKSEAGKSSTLNGLGYALGGAATLTETLADTVTWGQKESSLKVELEFKVNNLTYTIRRGKSGAELDVAGKLTVTGHKEVTLYVEKLLGTDIKTAMNLMLANQSKLRGALTDGPAATVALIESLANFSLIDEIIASVQDKLPNGNTLALQAAIANYEQQLAEPLEDGRADLQRAVDYALTDLSLVCAELAGREAALAEVEPAYREAVVLLGKVNKAEDKVNAAKQVVESARTRVKALPEPNIPDMSTVPTLQKEIEEHEGHAKALAVKALLLKLPTGAEWDAGAESLAAEINRLQGVRSVLQNQASAEAVRIAELSGRLIKETHCAFCDKDLTDVPEVVTRNNSLGVSIASSKLSKEALRLRIEGFDADLKELLAVSANATTCAAVYQKAAAYITLDDRYVPARWTWIGSDLSKPTNPNAAKQLNTLTLAQREALATLGKRVEATERLTEACKVLVDAEAALAHAKGFVEAVEPDLATYSLALQACEQVKPSVSAAKATLAEATQALNQVQGVYEERVKQRARMQADTLKSEELLKQTNFNNALLKKLRAARSVVADKLWSSVLGTVSSCFSSMRNQASSVTRSSGGFLVDGKSVGGLSSSTLDLLGLAIRMALTKTFLPNSRFLVLDEASAACDAEREQDMIAAVAAADFDQVLWVTHSDAVEAFASNAIQL